MIAKSTRPTAGAAPSAPRGASAAARAAGDGVAAAPSLAARARARARSEGASKRSSTETLRPLSGPASRDVSAATSLDARSEWPPARARARPLSRSRRQAGGLDGWARGAGGDVRGGRWAGSRARAPRSKKESSGEYSPSARLRISAQIGSISASSAAAGERPAPPIGPRRAPAGGGRLEGGGRAVLGLGSFLRSSFRASPSEIASSRVNIQWAGSECAASSRLAASRTECSHTRSSAAAAAAAAASGNRCATSALGWPVASSTNGTTATRPTPGSAPMVASTYEMPT